MAKNELDENHLLTFSDFLRDSTGISFNESNWIGLKISLKERMIANRIDRPESYLTRLRGDAHEREELIALVVVPETYFYRNRRQFDALGQHVLPRIISQKRSVYGAKPKIKIVSCGCSVGAEPYSLAITLFKHKLLEEADFQINAFDINPRAIERAQRGIYSKHYFREPHVDLTPYFELQGNNFVLRDKVAERVNFYRCNLFDLKTKDFVLREADVVFFRNVLIYFNDEGVLRALQTIAENMARDGYLFLGHAETLLWRNTAFDMEKVNGTIVWRLKEAVTSKGASTQPVDRALTKAQKPNTEKLILPPIESSRPKLPDLTRTKKDIEESPYESAVGYHAIKQLDKAKSAYLAQLSIDKDHLPSLIGLARIYADTGKDKLATATCEIVIEKDNLLPDGYFTMGMIEYKNNRYDAAVKYFKKTIYCDDQHFTAQYYLGLSLKEMGKTDSANKQFRIAAHIIDGLKSQDLTKEIGGYNASYILSLCIDSIV